MLGNFLPLGPVEQTAKIRLNFLGRPQYRNLLCQVLCIKHSQEYVRQVAICNGELHGEIVWSGFLGKSHFSYINQ